MWILQLLAKVQKASFSMKKHEKSKILARFSKHMKTRQFSAALLWQAAVNLFYFVSKFSSLFFSLVIHSEGGNWLLRDRYGFLYPLSKLSSHRNRSCCHFDKLLFFAKELKMSQRGSRNFGGEQRKQEVFLRW